MIPGIPFNRSLQATKLLARLLEQVPAAVKTAFVAAGGGVTVDGNKGDITVSNSGGTLGINDGSVSEVKQVLSDVTTLDVSTTKHGYVPKAPNDKGQFLRGDGTWAPPGVLLYKSGNESVSSTTLQADDHLTTTLEASSIYSFRFVLFVDATGALEGLKLALDGTAGVSALKAQISIYDDVSNALAAFARVTAFASSVGASLSVGGSYATIEGSIQTSTAGTFFLSWAQNGGAGASPTTIQVGSTMSAVKV